MKSHIFNYRFYLWNPATNTKSAEFGSFDQQYNPRHLFDREMLTFGCDIFTGTYKIVATLPEQDVSVDYHDRICHVRVLSLGDNCWRNINSFPLTPLISDYNNGVHLSGTVSWLAIREYNFRSYDRKYINNVEQFVIVTLNLSTETYTQFCYLPVLMMSHGIIQLLQFLWTAFAFPIILRELNLLYGK
jgi:F-box interacting protein